MPNIGPEVLDGVPPSVVTGNHTITSNESVTLADATSGSFVLTLPAAATVTGRSFTVVKTDSTTNTVTIDPNGAELIGIVSTYVLEYAQEYVTLYSTGTAWFVTAE
jgi:VCBS repeat-containing protein